MTGKRVKNRTVLIVLGIALYIALLFLLILAESADSETQIRSLPAAFWYSITTLTTVGYGDIVPMTTAGKAIGIIFQLMSLGVLAALVGLAVSVFSGRFLPMVRLRMNRGKKWYIFAGQNERCRILAKALKEDSPEHFVIFENDPFTLPEILSRKRRDGKAVLFFLEDNMPENERRSREYEKNDIQICCLSSTEPEKLSEHMIRFDPYENCARIYWSKHPAEGKSEKIAVIGGGKYAFALLEQAFLVNVIDPEQQIFYRLYGDFEDFMNLHPYLDQMMNRKDGDLGRDRLIYVGKEWNKDLTGLREADRILVCCEQEEDTLLTLETLFRYCPLKGKVHARISVPFDRAEIFGNIRELYTPEHVLKQTQNQLAICLHEQYRAGVSGPVPEWKDLGAFTRRSNLAAADHLETKVRILTGRNGSVKLTEELCREAARIFGDAGEKDRLLYRKIEHMRWMRFHVLNNWQYAPVRNDAERLHPMLVPFDRLSKENQVKDDLAWKVLENMTGLPESEYNGVK